MKKSLRVLALMHQDLVPPPNLGDASEQQRAEFKMEQDVLNALGELGHEVRPLGVYSDLNPIREAIAQWQPHLCFVLLEEFHGVVLYDHLVVGYLELMRQPYTGCNPRGMMLSRDKALTKKILAYHRIPSPQFVYLPRGRRVQRPSRLRFPLIVKSAVDDASLGVAQASVVQTDEALRERVQFIHDSIQSDALAEEYIDGRELYVGLLGNDRVQTLPIWEMFFDQLADSAHPIATAKVKWDSRYQKKHGIRTGQAEGLTAEVEAHTVRLCKRVYQALEMTGYARMDLRLRDDGQIFVIEANANPNLAFGEDFAESAAKSGISYQDLIQRILNLGLRFRAAWQED